MKRIRHRYVYIFLNLVIVSICAIVVCSASFAANLRDVVQQALVENPSIVSAQASEMESQFGIKRAKSGYFPQVDVRVARGEELSDNNFVRAALGKQQIRLARQEHAITVNQILFDGWRVKSQVRSQQHSLSASTYGLENSKVTLIRDVAQVYLNVLRARELILLALNNIDVHQKTLAAVNLRFRGGAGTNGEVELARSRLELARLRLTTAQGTEKRFNSRYLALTGSMPPKTMAMPASLKSYLPKSLHEGTDVGLAHSPALNRAKAQEKASRSEVGIAKAAFMPRFNLELVASDGDNLDGVPGRNRDVVAAVTLNYAVFHGGSDLAQLNQARTRDLARREDIEAARRGVIETVLRYWSDIQTDLMRYQQQRSYVNYSKNVVLDYKQQFTLGKRALFNVLDAEDELFRARTGLTEAYYDTLIDYYQILAAMGVLSENML